MISINFRITELLHITILLFSNKIQMKIKQLKLSFFVQKQLSS